MTQSAIARIAQILRDKIENNDKAKLVLPEGQTLIAAHLVGRGQAFKEILKLIEVELRN